MALLDQLFANLGAPDDWAQRMGMGAQATGGQPTGMPAVGERKIFPSPESPKMEQPRMSLGGASGGMSAPVEAPGIGTYLKGALQGFGGKGGGSGILGAIGGAMNAGEEVTQQNELYQTLTANGVEPRTAQLMLRQPGAYKVIEAIKEKNRETTQQSNVATWLMKNRGKSPEEAAAIASNPALLQQYLKPEDQDADLNRRKTEAEIAKLERDAAGGGSVDDRTKGAPPGMMWVDPANPSAGVAVIPGARAGNAIKLTDVDKKAIQEADDMVRLNKASVGTVEQALKVNEKAWEGPLASPLTAKVDAWITGDESSKATLEYDNLTKTLALESLKSTFGGNPTEGERQILLDLQGSVDQPKTVRKEILERFKAKAEKRVQFNRWRANALRNGDYYASNVEFSDDWTPNSSGGASAPDSGGDGDANRTKFKTPGGFAFEVIP